MTTERKYLSVIVAAGTHTAVDPDIVVANAGIIENSDRAEFIFVDDLCQEALRGALFDVRGTTRVLHTNPPYGTRDALATGLQLATGDIVIFAAPDIELNSELLDALLVPFGLDPGMGFTFPTTLLSDFAEGNTAALATPMIAVRRDALDSIGGVRAIAGLGEVTNTRGPLLRHAVISKLIASNWRYEQIAATVTHRDGLIELWERDETNQLTALDQPYWNPPFHVRSPRPGINVVGLLDAACGVGTAARRYVEAIAATETDYATFSYHGHGSPELDYTHHDGETFAFDTNLIALNPDLVRLLAVHAGGELWASSRYTIGLWFWELEQLTPIIESGFAFVNEIWAASSYMATAFASATDKPVTTIPLPVARRDGSPQRSRASLGLPERYTFLSIFDFGSLADRKNPYGVIQAFCRAFQPDEGPMLVLKTLNASWDKASWQALRRAIGSRRDIRVVDGYVDDEVVAEMIGSADCYVSLHRAEGFGLTPAEALAWGRPVIATRYSGNLDFMNETNSFLVPFTMTPIHPRNEPTYPRTARWAEPDIAVAAQLMRHVVDCPNDASARGLIGQRDIRRTHGIDTVAKIISLRMEEINRSRRPRQHGSSAPPRPHRQLATTTRHA